jgi:O-antigen/teichoic acid export membrane protein
LFHPESGRFSSIAYHSILNLSAGGLLLLLSILLVPAMLRSFGLQIYGVLVVTWMVLGHLSWLDLGLSVATNRYVTAELTRGDRIRAARWVWTALIIQTLIGVLGAVALWCLASSLTRWLSIDESARPLVTWMLRMFAVAIPLGLCAGSLNAVLEATRRFGWSNALAVGAAVGSYGAFGLGILANGDVQVLTYAMLAVKAVHLGLLWWTVRRLVPLSLWTLAGLFERSWAVEVRGLLGFSGWSTVNGALGPVLLTYDRWVISFLLGAGALPYYAVPFNLLQRLQILPGSVARAAFPVITSLIATGAWRQVSVLLARLNQSLIPAVVGVLFVVFVWGGPVLTLWLGQEFASVAVTPLQMLAAGFAVALLAPFAGTLLASAGRPDITARLYVVELPVNLIVVTVLTREFGLLGAAASFLIRALLETALVWWLALRVLPLDPWLLAGGFWRPLTASTPLALGAILIHPVEIDFKSVLATSTCLAASAVAIGWMLRGNKLKRPIAAR